MGPVKGMTETPEVHCLPQSQSLLAFIVRSYRDFSSWHLNLGLGAPGV